MNRNQPIEKDSCGEKNCRTLHKDSRGQKSFAKDLNSIVVYDDEGIFMLKKMGELKRSDKKLMIFLVESIKFARPVGLEVEIRIFCSISPMSFPFTDIYKIFKPSLKHKGAEAGLSMHMTR